MIQQGYSPGWMLGQERLIAIGIDADRCASPPHHRQRVLALGNMIDGEPTLVIGLIGPNHLAPGI